MYSPKFKFTFIIKHSRIHLSQILCGHIEKGTTKIVFFCRTFKYVYASIFNCGEKVMNILALNLQMKVFIVVLQRKGICDIGFLWSWRNQSQIFKFDHVHCEARCDIYRFAPFLRLIQSTSCAFIMWFWQGIWFEQCSLLLYRGIYEKVSEDVVASVSG